MKFDEITKKLFTKIYICLSSESFANGKRDTLCTVVASDHPSLSIVL